MIGLYLDEYTLSSALPDSFQITGEQEPSVTVAICLEREWIYSVKLYPVDGTCTFYELRQIVEQNMIKRNLSLATFELTVDDGNGMEEYDGYNIIFSRYKNATYSDIYFLEHHFLVNRSYYTMPRNESAYVQFFARYVEIPLATYEATFEHNGYISTYSADQQITRYPRDYVYNIHVTPAQVKSLVDEMEGGDMGTLLSFTLHVGERSLMVYVTDDIPCTHFYYRNSYNAWETIFVFGTTSFKSEISRKEALMQNRTSFYDKTVTRKWEVKTVPLTIEEATWYNEFLEAESIFKDISCGYTGKTVLVSDITSEISDSVKDRITIKFSWRFDDNAYWLDSTPSEREFTPQFNRTFT